MSFLSNLSRKLGFTAGDEEMGEELEDNEFAEDEDDEEEEDAGRPSFRFPNPFRGRVDQAGFEEEEEESEPAPAPQARTSRRGNVIHDARMEARASGAQSAPSAAYTHRERIVNVRQIEECREIIKYLLQGESVLLNLENIDPKDCGRVVDLLSGAAFALQGRMLKVAHLSYLLAPQNVEVIEPKGSVSDRARYR